jgi:hypothetical protein
MDGIKPGLSMFKNGLASSGGETGFVFSLRAHLEVLGCGALKGHLIDARIQRVRKPGSSDPLLKTASGFWVRGTVAQLRLGM